MLPCSSEKINNISRYRIFKNSITFFQSLDLFQVETFLNFSIGSAESAFNLFNKKRYGGNWEECERRRPPLLSLSFLDIEAISDWISLAYLPPFFFLNEKRKIVLALSQWALETEFFLGSLLWLLPTTWNSVWIEWIEAHRKRVAPPWLWAWTHCL